MGALAIHCTTQHDIVVIRRMALATRVSAMWLFLAQQPLLYILIYLCSPVRMPVTYLGSGASWIYGWGRYLTGSLACPLCALSSMHMAFRWAGLLACMCQFFMDSLSAITLAAAIKCLSAGTCKPVSNWSLSLVVQYYRRDLLCVALDVLMVLLVGYLFCALGFGVQPLYTYAELHDGVLKRNSEMVKEYVRVFGVRSQAKRRSRRKKKQASV
jgi:hypothetical protein